MDHSDPHLNFRHGSQQIIAEDNKQLARYPVEDDEPRLLDPSVFVSGILPHRDSSAFTHRKGSFASLHPVMSPNHQSWEMQQFVAADTSPEIDADSGVFAHSMMEQRRQSQQQHMPVAFHGYDARGWSDEPTSGDITPVTGLEPNVHPHNDMSTFSRPQIERRQSEFEHAHGLLPQSTASQPPLQDQQYLQARHSQTIDVDHQAADWMALAQQESEAKPGPKRVRRPSPQHTVLDTQRRDAGIHKKNKRIDIPQERNIQTIDHMIESTKDEDLLKELKGQKRLLRNREAALASRQRKKKHTEDLESKEKNYQSQINTLQAQVESLRLERDTWSKERQILIHQNQESDRVIEVMHMEKRDMIMKHTEDTASLRKKIHVLTEQIDSAPSMSAAPSSSGYTDFNAEMEALSMGPHDWDNFLLVGHLPPDNASSELSFEALHQDSCTTPLGQAIQASKVEPPAETAKAVSTAEPPVASGLLFMLLLCGAFVASNGPSASSMHLPAMPDEVRSAAPKVLHNLLSDANTPDDLRQHSMTASLHDHPILSSSGGLTRKANRMTQMHRSLTAPTRQEEIDSAFALTQSQYAAHTGFDMTLHDEPHSLPRRTLGEALTDRSGSQVSGNKAEIYTRSLLWEQIPTEVVHQFKEMVRDHHELERRQQDQRQDNE